MEAEEKNRNTEDGRDQTSHIAFTLKEHVCEKAYGSSMEPTIKEGDYCIFRANVVGSRQGKIVLAQHRDIKDPEKQ